MPPWPPLGSPAGRVASADGPAPFAVPWAGRMRCRRPRTDARPAPSAISEEIRSRCTGARWRSGGLGRLRSLRKIWSRSSRPRWAHRHHPIIIPSASHQRRISVASASHQRRIIMASSWHHHGIPVATATIGSAIQRTSTCNDGHQLHEQVNDYSAIQEASTAKKAARKLLRQVPRL